ncbi:hypothetical protein B2G50_09470 [Leptospira interrogans serovar Canicola]|nr:hypothetical protein B2G47_05440 [Leptospira interrogans serovar Canicola]ASV10144.1 hypothetical protein B2G50_09470 [Leptospira interrogans serovar Canicola]
MFAQNRCFAAITKLKIHFRTCPKTVQCRNYYENLTSLELLESSQIAKYDLICRNHCVLLKISKELSRKIF